jgi:hypothetical protein
MKLTKVAQTTTHAATGGHQKFTFEQTEMSTPTQKPANQFSVKHLKPLMKASDPSQTVKLNKTMKEYYSLNKSAVPSSEVKLRQPFKPDALNTLRSTDSLKSFQKQNS